MTVNAFGEAELRERALKFRIEAVARPAHQFPGPQPELLLHALPVFTGEFFHAGNASGFAAAGPGNSAGARGRFQEGFSTGS